VFFNVKQRAYSDLAFDWGAGPGSGLGLAFEFNLRFDAGFFFAIAGFALAFARSSNAACKASARAWVIRSAQNP
jgi:hypothetical protein